MCYTISVNRRGPDRLPLKVLPKVCVISPVVSFPIGPSRRVCLLITSFLRYRVGGAPDYHWWFHGDSFLTTGKDLWPPERCGWRCGKSTHTLVGETDPWLWKRHWQLGTRRVSFLRWFSSVGQSHRLITGRSKVRSLESPPSSKFNNQRRHPNVTSYRSRSSVSCHNRISDLVLGTNSEQSHQMVLCPGDAFRSSSNPRILVLRSSSDSLTEMAVGKDRHSYPPLAQSAEAMDSKSIQSRFEFGAEDHPRLMRKPTPTEEWSNLTGEQKSAAVLNKWPTLTEPSRKNFSDSLERQTFIWAGSTVECRTSCRKKLVRL